MSEKKLRVVMNQDSGDNDIYYGDALLVETAQYTHLKTLDAINAIVAPASELEVVADEDPDCEGAWMLERDGETIAWVYANHDDHRPLIEKWFSSLGAAALNASAQRDAERKLLELLKRARKCVYMTHQERISPQGTCEVAAFLRDADAALQAEEDDA